MSDNQIKGNLVERAAIYVVCIAAAIMIAHMRTTLSNNYPKCSITPSNFFY